MYITLKGITKPDTPGLHQANKFLRAVSTIQGRPLGIRDEAFDVQLPTFEEVETDCAGLRNSALIPDTPIAHLAASALHNFKLDFLVSQIKMRFYHFEKKANDFVWSSDARSSQASLRQQLDMWRDEISRMRSPSADVYEVYGVELHRNKEKLHNQYHATMVLLHQPSQAIPRPDEEALLTCYQAAAGRLQGYADLYTTEGLCQDWRSVQGIFSSGATMIYCLWTSPMVRRSVPSTEWGKSLRTCTNLLSVGGEWWPSAKRGLKSFSSALDALTSKFDTPQSTHSRRQEEQQSIDNPRMFASHLGPSRDSTSSFALTYDTNAHCRQTFNGETTGIEVGGQRMSLTVSATESYPLPQHTFDTLLEGGDWPNFVANGSPDQFYFEPRANGQPDTLFGREAGWTGPGNMHNPDFAGPDPTIEAFITDFLDGNTAWNPF